MHYPTVTFLRSAATHWCTVLITVVCNELFFPFGVINVYLKKKRFGHSLAFLIVFVSHIISFLLN